MEERIEELHKVKGKKGVKEAIVSGVEGEGKDNLRMEQMKEKEKELYAQIVELTTEWNLMRKELGGINRELKRNPGLAAATQKQKETRKVIKDLEKRIAEINDEYNAVAVAR
ncbi:hypothetical protein AJ80_02022 [Polytolypa hystricis UAMH7299]|uniref:Uncharacterized protein n=1 Tax=Polytolypa hystricis (strain UAMH7299) TaxID=1447883 RepID=A0A2B7YRZ8_POLH7|nr:hypothetical protein AJ80_02022 [Polytolypa hystricis UAMH7299]